MLPSGLAAHLRCLRQKPRNDRTPTIPDLPKRRRRAHAEQEFGKFRVLDDQRFDSDFDHMVKRLPGEKPQ